MIKGIGFSGKMQAGKDTCSDFISTVIAPNRATSKLAFADAMKDMCIQYFGLTHDDCYTQEGKERYNDFWGMTNREILQKIGTDAMRNGFHSDVWVKLTELRLQKLVKNDTFFLVTDVRFPNEIECIKRNGGIVVHIDRPQLTLSSTHVSESSIDETTVDHVINNSGTLDQLCYKVACLYNTCQV